MKSLKNANPLEIARKRAAQAPPPLPTVVEIQQPNDDAMDVDTPAEAQSSFTYKDYREAEAEERTKALVLDSESDALKLRYPDDYAMSITRCSRGIELLALEPVAQALKLRLLTFGMRETKNDKFDAPIFANEECHEFGSNTALAVELLVGALGELKTKYGSFMANQAKNASAFGETSFKPGDYFRVTVPESPLVDSFKVALKALNEYIQRNRLTNYSLFDDVPADVPTTTEKLLKANLDNLIYKWSRQYVKDYIVKHGLRKPNLDPKNPETEKILEHLSRWPQSAFDPKGFKVGPDEVALTFSRHAGLVKKSSRPKHRTQASDRNDAVKTRRPNRFLPAWTKMLPLLVDFKEMEDFAGGDFKDFAPAVQQMLNEHKTELLALTSECRRRIVYLMKVIANYSCALSFGNEDLSDTALEALESDCEHLFAGVRLLFLIWRDDIQNSGVEYEKKLEKTLDPGSMIIDITGSAYVELDALVTSRLKYAIFRRSRWVRFTNTTNSCVAVLHLIGMLMRDISSFEKGDNVVRSTVEQHQEIAKRWMTLFKLISQTAQEWLKLKQLPQESKLDKELKTIATETLHFLVYLDQLRDSSVLLGSNEIPLKLTFLSGTSYVIRARNDIKKTVETALKSLMTHSREIAYFDALYKTQFKMATYNLKWQQAFLRSCKQYAAINGEIAMTTQMQDTDPVRMPIKPPSKWLTMELAEYFGFQKVETDKNNKPLKSIELPEVITNQLKLCQELFVRVDEPNTVFPRVPINPYYTIIECFAHPVIGLALAAVYGCKVRIWVQDEAILTKFSDLLSEVIEKNTKEIREEKELDAKRLPLQKPNYMDVQIELATANALRVLKSNNANLFVVLHDSPTNYRKLKHHPNINKISAMNAAAIFGAINDCANQTKDLACQLFTDFEFETLGTAKYNEQDAKEGFMPEKSPFQKLVTLDGDSFVNGVSVPQSFYYAMTQLPTRADFTQRLPRRVSRFFEEHKIGISEQYKLQTGVDTAYLSTAMNKALEGKLIQHTLSPVNLAPVLTVQPNSAILGLGTSQLSQMWIVGHKFREDFCSHCYSDIQTLKTKIECSCKKFFFCSAQCQTLFNQTHKRAIIGQRHLSECAIHEHVDFKKMALDFLRFYPENVIMTSDYTRDLVVNHLRLAFRQLAMFSTEAGALNFESDYIKHLTTRYKNAEKRSPRRTALAKMLVEIIGLVLPSISSKWSANLLQLIDANIMLAFSVFVQHGPIRVVRKFLGFALATAHLERTCFEDDCCVRVQIRQGTNNSSPTAVFNFGSQKRPNSYALKLIAVPFWLSLKMRQLILTVEQSVCCTCNRCKFESMQSEPAYLDPDYNSNQRVALVMLTLNNPSKYPQNMSKYLQLQKEDEKEDEDEEEEEEEVDDDADYVEGDGDEKAPNDQQFEEENPEERYDDEDAMENDDSIDDQTDDEA